MLGPNVRRNLESVRQGSSGNVTVAHLDWFDFAANNEQDQDMSLAAAKQWWTSVTGGGETKPQWPDILVTTDTFYDPKLVIPLLHTLRAFSLAMVSDSSKTDTTTTPMVLIALERRDPTLIDGCLEQARQMGFKLVRIADGRVRKALIKSGWTWASQDPKQGDWDGVEVYKGRLVNP